MPQESPSALLPDEVQTGLPEVQTIFLLSHDVGSLQSLPAPHATHAPALHTPIVQPEPSSAFSDLTQLDAPLLHDVSPCTHSPRSVQGRPAVQDGPASPP